MPESPDEKTGYTGNPDDEYTEDVTEEDLELAAKYPPTPDEDAEVNHNG